MTRPYPDDHLLWFAISGGLFLPFLGVWLVTERITRGTLDRIGNDILFLAFGCAIVGWVAQAVLVMCGIRLADRPPPVEAADYDDASPDQPSAALENPPPDQSGPDEFP